MPSLIWHLTACLALLSTTAIAQRDIRDQDYSQNLTLRFFTQPQEEDKCSYYNTSSALTFTTRSIPIIGHCFNLIDLFGGNSTSGFVNQTRNAGYTPSNGKDLGIDWQLYNADLFDPQANYSSVLYRQHVANPGDDRYEPGNYADRLVNLYGVEGCKDADVETGESYIPWYGFSCWSEDEGTCGATNRTFASFRLQPGITDKDDQDGKCWSFAQWGAAPDLQVRLKAAVGAVIAVGTGLWMAM